GQLLCILSGDDRGGAGASARRVAGIATGAGRGRRGIVRGTRALVLAGVSGEPVDRNVDARMVEPQAASLRPTRRYPRTTHRCGRTALLARLPGLRGNLLDAAFGNRTILVHRNRRTALRTRGKLAHAGRVDRGEPVAVARGNRLQNASVHRLPRC